jgi:hypothetical protein
MNSIEAIAAPLTPSLNKEHESGGFSLNRCWQYIQIEIKFQFQIDGWWGELTKCGNIYRAAHLKLLQK